MEEKREDIAAIEFRLNRAGVPAEYIQEHLRAVEKWRANHDTRVPREKRQRKRAR